MICNFFDLLSNSMHQLTYLIDSRHTLTSPSKPTARRVAALTKTHIYIYRLKFAPPSLYKCYVSTFFPYSFSGLIYFFKYYYPTQCQAVPNKIKLSHFQKLNSLHRINFIMLIFPSFMRLPTNFL